MLEQAGLGVVNESWDLIPGTHRVGWLDRVISQARCTIAVVSDGYLSSPEAVAQWARPGHRGAGPARTGGTGRPRRDVQWQRKRRYRPDS